MVYMVNFGLFSIKSQGCQGMRSDEQVMSGYVGDPAEDYWYQELSWTPDDPPEGGNCVVERQA